MIDTAGTGTDTSGSVTSSVASGSTSGGTVEVVGQEVVTDDNRWWTSLQSNRFSTS